MLVLQAILPFFPPSYSPCPVRRLTSPKSGNPAPSPSSPSSTPYSSSSRSSTAELNSSFMSASTSCDEETWLRKREVRREEDVLAGICLK